MSAALRRKIFAACRELGLDEDARRDLQRRATGHESLSGMSEPDLRKVLKALENAGFKPTPKPGLRPRAPRGDLRFIHKLWRLLGEAGVLDNPTREGLNAFVRRRFGEAWGYVPRDIDDLREPAQIDDVVTALKRWCQRTDTGYDRDLHS